MVIVVPAVFVAADENTGAVESIVMTAESVLASGPDTPPAVIESAFSRIRTVPSLEHDTVIVIELPDAALGVNVHPVAVVSAATASKSALAIPEALAENESPYENDLALDVDDRAASHVADGLLTIEKDWVTVGAAANVAFPACEA